jgi:Archaeal glycosylation protein B long peripheral domain/AglB core domain
MSGHFPRVSMVVVLAIVGTVSWTARELDHEKIPVPERNTWITSDMDTLYHARRVDRLLREGRVAGRDPYLSFPDGSAIPWPPYYTWLAGAWTAPGAPHDPEARRAWVERRVASLPRACGVATSLVAALGAAALAGPAAGLLAGTSHALSAASLVTSRVGNGDHHAFLALLSLAMWVLVSRAFRPAALDDRRGSALRGVAVGFLAGLALGSWVASLLQLVLLQAVLGVMLVRHARRPIPGLAPFGLALHGAALATVLPAVVTSPWNVEAPWSVVDLSWFHALWLSLGALVFVPPLRRLPRRLGRTYPAVVALVLAGLAATVFLAHAGPAAAIRQGFSWLGRNEIFMSVVGESRSLFRFDAILVLGGLLFALPFAWGACAWQAFRHARTDLLPWAVVVPALAAQAGRQARFADLLAAPMAIVVAWALAAALRSRALSRVRAIGRRAGPFRGALAGALALGVAFAAHADVASYTWSVRHRAPGSAGVTVSVPERVVREFAEWIRQRTAGSPRDFSVLATWSWGHELEWVADCPSVATNFGTFVGEDAFAEPARFFMSEDPAQAEAILERHRSRFVIATSALPNQAAFLAYVAGAADGSKYVTADSHGLAPLPRWYRTLGARLLFDGGVLRSDGSVAEPLGYLRLVNAFPGYDPRFTMRPRPTLVGLLWEHVPGATVEAHGAPGDELRLALPVSYARARYTLTWTGSAIADSTGVARLRVPYATDQPNGEGVADGPAQWRFGTRTGEVTIPAAAVLGGRAVALPEE